MTPTPRYVPKSPGIVTRVAGWIGGVVATGLAVSHVVVSTHWALTSGSSQAWVGFMAAGIVIVLFPVAVLMARGLQRSGRLAALVERRGVPAVAVVTSVHPAWVGEDRGVAVGLRISADGVPAVDASVKCDADERLVVGVELPAVIDRETLAFQLATPLVTGATIPL